MSKRFAAKRGADDSPSESESSVSRPPAKKARNNEKIVEGIGTRRRKSVANARQADGDESRKITVTSKRMPRSRHGETSQDKRVEDGIVVGLSTQGRKSTTDLGQSGSAEGRQKLTPPTTRSRAGTSDADANNDDEDDTLKSSPRVTRGRSPLASTRARRRANTPRTAGGSTVDSKSTDPPSTISSRTTRSRAAGTPPILTKTEKTSTRSKARMKQVDGKTPKKDDDSAGTVLRRSARIVDGSPPKKDDDSAGTGLRRSARIKSSHSVAE